jgi:hypothetical protein
MRTIVQGVLLGAVGVVLAAGCGGGSSMGNTAGGCPSAASVDITSTGFAPKTACIVAGGRLTFTNTDAIEHDVEDATSICTPLGTPAAPLQIPAGANHLVTLSLPATCGFTDAAHLGDPAFTGTVTIGAGSGGSGYP